MPNGCTNFSFCIYASTCMSVHAHTHTQTHSYLGTGSAFNNLFSFMEWILPASGCAAELMAPSALTLEWQPLVHLVPWERKALCWQVRLASLRARSHKGRIVPIPKLLIVKYLPPALLLMRITHQAGRTADSPVVGLMNNSIGSLKPVQLTAKSLS